MKHRDDRYFQWPLWLRSFFRDLSPDFVIRGKEGRYLERWYIIPRNRLFNIYLHQVHRDDDDRALHDHPWWNMSLILKGAYMEVVPDWKKAPTVHLRVADVPTRIILRKRGSIIFRRPTSAHRLEVARGPVWTLFITGPWRRNWGFHCKWGFRPWEDFVNPEDTGSVGKGCD